MIRKSTLSICAFTLVLASACSNSACLYKQNSNTSNLLPREEISDERYKNFEPRTEDNYTQLMSALETKQPLNEIKRLLDGGSNVNAVQMEFLRIVKPTLIFAIQRGEDEESVEIIRLLLEKGADLTLQTYNRVQDKKIYGFMSLLHYAVIYSSPEIVQILVDAGADVNFIPAPDSGLANTNTPLETAILLNKHKTTEILIKAGARVKMDLPKPENQVFT